MNFNIGFETTSVEDLKKKIELALKTLDTFEVKGRFGFNINAHPNHYYDQPVGFADGGVTRLKTEEEIKAAQEPKKEEKSEPVEAEKVEAPKAEKKEKKETKAKKDAPVETTVAETKPETTSDLTKEDVANACQKVSETKNLDAAKAVLASFVGADGKPCRRISDVKVAEYAAFIDACEKALA